MLRKPRDRWVEALATKYDHEFVELMAGYTKGIRVDTLKNLMLFSRCVRQRFQNNNWIEWKESPKGDCIVRYLEHCTKDEIAYYQKALNWSSRRVYDYWRTLFFIALIVQYQ